MYSKTCTCILLAVYCYLSGLRALEIEIKQRGNEVLVGNDTELTCSFTITPGDNVVSVLSLSFSVSNVTSNTFDALFYITPQSTVTYLPAGDYLKNRVKINSTFISTYSGQATLSFQNLTCVDEKDYKCHLTIFKSTGMPVPTTVDSNTTNIVVQASPLQPETVSQLNSTRELVEDEHFAFECAGNVGKPPGRYIWQKIRKHCCEPVIYNNTTTETIQAPHTCTYNGTSVLTIRLTADDNQAIVRCAEQSMPSLYKDSNPINVLYKVRNQTITKNPNHAYYRVGSGYIELKCYADGNPQINYIWYKEDNMTQTLSLNASLVIDSNANNNGTYVCKAFNSLNGKIYPQFQSVHVLIVYEIPSSTSSTVIATTANKAGCEQEYCKIGAGVGAGAGFGLVIAIIFAIVRSRRKKSGELLDTDDATLSNNSPTDKDGSSSASMNKGYKDTENLSMSSMKKGDRQGTSCKENKTLNYVEVDFIDDKTQDKKPVQEHSVRKNETVYSVVQKTKSVGNTKERMFTAERPRSKRDEDDPYADNNELYDHLGNSRHKAKTAGEIFDHQQSSPEAKNSEKF